MPDFPQEAPPDMPTEEPAAEVVADQPVIEPGAPYGEPAPDAPALLDAHADLTDVELPVEHDPNPQATVNAQPIDEPVAIEDVNTTRVKTEVLGPTPGVPAGSDSPVDPAHDIAPADHTAAPAE